MALRTLRRLSSGGDTVLAEWDTDTLTPERLQEIEKEYKELVSKGFAPFDITDKKDAFIGDGKFHPEADTLLIPRMQGGAE